MDVSNSADVLDSRDVIKRIEELEADLDNCKSRGEAGKFAKCEKCPNTSDCEELKALKSLAEDGEGSPDWNHGETLIRESYFKDYARELANDIGATRAEGWPNDCIDWDKAADQLKQDYRTVDFDGVTYYIRA